MNDNEAFYFGTDNDVNVYWNGTYLCMDGASAELRISFGTPAGTRIYGGITTGDDLLIYPNTVDGVTYLRMDGNGDFMISHASDKLLKISDGAGNYLSFNDDATDMIMTSVMDTKNLFLKTTGTGVVKFGVYDATPALASAGFIPILDAAGNVRKLMVQA
jgi:hypothetical protein